MTSNHQPSSDPDPTLGYTTAGVAIGFLTIASVLYCIFRRRWKPPPPNREDPEIDFPVPAQPATYHRAKLFELAHGVDHDTGRGLIMETQLDAITEILCKNGPGSAWQFDVVPTAGSVMLGDRGSVTFCLSGEQDYFNSRRKERGMSVQTKLPLWFATGRTPRTPFAYFEVLIEELAKGTTVAVGLATTPYPTFRLPGWHPHSVGYYSDDGRLFVTNPFVGTSFGPPCGVGDTIGVGYVPSIGATFFAVNGELIVKRKQATDLGWDGITRLPSEEGGFCAVWGPKVVYPTIGADGDCKLDVNFGAQDFTWKAGNASWWPSFPLLAGPHNTPPVTHTLPAYPVTD